MGLYCRSDLEWICKVLSKSASMLLVVLQTWPLCFTVNHDNGGYRKPINPLIDDLQACDRLYNETLQLINDKASVKIKGVNC